MRKFLILFLVIGLWVISQPAALQAAMVTVEIISDQSGNLPIYPTVSKESSTYRAYVEAVRGMRYGIRIRNNSPYRVGVVIAVDGRNVISGEKSFLRRDERMYVLDPHGWGTYDGWRTSKTQVNRFYFTEAPDSYAGAWGDFSAMGVIAMAVFPERRPSEPLYERREHSDSMQRVPGLSSKAEPGTGFGEGKYSPTVRVEFEPEQMPSERHFLKYEWRETLCRKGIIDCRRPHNRFWEEEGRYAPYPPRR